MSSTALASSPEFGRFSSNASCPAMVALSATSKVASSRGPNPWLRRYSDISGGFAAIARSAGFPLRFLSLTCTQNLPPFYQGSLSETATEIIHAFQDMFLQSSGTTVPTQTPSMFLCENGKTLAHIIVPRTSLRVRYLLRYKSLFKLFTQLVPRT